MQGSVHFDGHFGVHNSVLNYAPMYKYIHSVAIGEPMTHVLTKPFLDSVAFMCGAGNMLALVVLHRADYRAMAKIGFVPGLSNISEPIYMPFVKAMDGAAGAEAAEEA